jgi:hypothetical protein
MFHVVCKEDMKKDGKQGAGFAVSAPVDLVAITGLRICLIFWGDRENPRNVPGL